LVAPGCRIKQTFRIRAKLRLNRQDGIIKAKGSSATFLAPEKPGSYRVHLRVTDDRKRAATGNFPIKVK
jgi:hypothetical protein